MNRHRMVHYIREIAKEKRDLIPITPSEEGKAALQIVANTLEVLARRQVEDLWGDLSSIMNESRHVLIQKLIRRIQNDAARLQKEISNEAR